jgi:predicted DNA-binding transcriptional regulator AlpA
MLAVSVRTVWRLSDKGAPPRPVRLGSMVRWRRADIEDFLRNDLRAA